MRRCAAHRREARGRARRSELRPACASAQPRVTRCGPQAAGRRPQAAPEDAEEEDNLGHELEEDRRRLAVLEVVDKRAADAEEHVRDAKDDA